MPTADPSGPPGADGETVSLRDGERLLAALQELSRLRDLDGVLAVVRRVARELTGADGVTLVLREGDQVYYIDEEALGPLWKGRRFPMHSCISGWVMRSGTPAVIDDVFVDPRIPRDAYRPTFVKSLVMVPIREGDPIGAIGAYWKAPHLATPREISLLQTLAGSTSIAIANAALYREARAALDAAEAANRAKDEFLTVLSHELRTPLTSILGWSRILRGRADDPGAVARGLEVIERNAHVQARIIEDLLDVSRMVARELSVDLVPVDLCPLVGRCARDLRPAASAKGLDLHVETGGAPLVVAGDGARLSQIVENLGTNAVKFTPPGGRVEITCKREDDRAVVRVRDTGRGIAPSFLPHVFDRFRQQDGSRTRAHGGLGLGLAIVRYLVDEHHGEITVESEGEGRGTTVTVRLPILVPAATTDVVTEMSPAPLPLDTRS